jgi:hypothetical protein
MIDGWLAEKTLFTSHPEPRKGVIPDHALRSKAEGFEDSQTSERFSVIHLRERAKSWFLGHSVLYNMTRRVRGIRELASTLGLLATEEIPVFAQIDKSKWLKEAWDDHLKSFRELKKISDDNHAELLIVLIPPVQEISESLSVYTSYVDRFSERLRKFFQEERIQYLDLTPFFQEYAKRQLGIRSNARKELYWVYDCHLNVRGNESVGLLVTEYILDHGLIDIAHKEETKREVEEALKEFRE